MMKRLPGFEIDLHIGGGWCSWFTGLVDGEGCFEIQNRPHPGCRTGYESRVRLAIQLRADDHAVLEEIHRTLRIGHLYPTEQKGHNPTVKWQVADNSACYFVLIPLFDQYPLKSKKHRDYLIWKEAVTILHHEPPNKARLQRLQQLERLIKAGRQYQEERR